MSSPDQAQGQAQGRVRNQAQVNNEGVDYEPVPKNHHMTCAGKNHLHPNNPPKSHGHEPCVFRQDPSLPFFQRPMLRLPDIDSNLDISKLKISEKIDGKATSALSPDSALSSELQISPERQISIMTYNMLAQALTSRSQFRNSGSALKWASRSKALLAEIKYYDPDLLCVQELDEDRWYSYWKLEFYKLGYTGTFHAHVTKKHGVAIIHKKSKFEFQCLRLVDYDAIEGLPCTTRTGNVALLVYLTFAPGFSDPRTSETSRTLGSPGNPQSPGTKTGIVVGTTHTYWHPFGTYERCRQAHILLQEFQAFEASLKSDYDSPAYYNFIAGDFNTDPEFPPYQFLINSSAFLNPQSRRTVCRERNYNFNYPAHNSQVAPKIYFSSEKALRDFNLLSEWRQKNSISAVSLYSMGYSQVHRKNSQPHIGEPCFSNWCDDFVALLDYIFVICKEPVRSPAQLLSQSGIRLLELLRMPEPSEMGLGLPQPNTYPSDHLCMIAKVELV